MKGLVLEHVTIALAGRTLFDIDAGIRPGEVLTVMGPSGSGKSTLLAYIGGFLDSTFTATGRVLLNGDDVALLPPENRHAGILFQDPLLFPHMSVAGNLIFAIPSTHRDRTQRQQLATDMLARVGLEGLDDRDPETLSGGQKARVALARVLISEPRMLLLDEPFSKLDAELRQQMRELVFESARATDLPTILVTHDAVDAEVAGGTVVRIGE